MLLAFDNDELGLGMQERLIKKYQDIYKIAVRCPSNKDWNEDLINLNLKNFNKYPNKESSSQIAHFNA